ncbi:GpE family phage tail protein [Veronia nyctiphanis]|uniref:GpE family phage tail protein n=1 Tax=Veronia nyctiphanis TaxID=1278244 RepID=A0A4Q0YNA1_9GAMM|nr:GpE family phage tail protein [Veronia nyctiphanis]RXJ70621.1 GpE family phage tail protein [Veronia nyctiphanis]
MGLCPGDHLFGVLADLATVFHWPPSELWELELADLSRWHREACKRAGGHHG